MPSVKYPVFESGLWTVGLMANQAYLGRAVVAAKRPVETLSLLTDQEWGELHEVMKQYEAAVAAAFGATMFNWTCLMNDAYKAVLPTPRVHWHVWPRYRTPVALGGYAFTDPGFGHHYDKTRQQEVDDRHLRLLIMEIQRALHVD